MDDPQKTQARTAQISVIQLPEYDVGEQIGEGGMARVYRALHKPLEREVALKVLLPEYGQDPAFAERFMREARIAARLVHPHIVQIYDVDQHEQDLYLAMEYVKGGDLSQKIEQGLSAKALLKATEELCEALDFAHSEGYIHRDIKPANILFRGDGSLVLSDFGIARSIRASTQLTQAGMILGTPTYMSPEQAEGKELTAASDLYSVGVLLFKVITGHAPYRSDSAIEILHQHLSAPIPQLPKTLPHLQVFFNRALAKDPAERYRSGARMAESLKLAFEHADDLIGIRKQFTRQMAKIDAAQRGKEQKKISDETVLREKAPEFASQTVAVAQEPLDLPADNGTGTRTEMEVADGVKLSAVPLWMKICGLLLICAVGVGIYALSSDSPENASTAELQLKNVEDDYIITLAIRAFDNYQRASAMKRELDTQLRRKMALGNTGDLDVDNIINTTIKGNHAEIEYYLNLAENDLNEIDQYWLHSPKRIYRILSKQENAVAKSGKTEQSEWLAGIRSVFQMAEKNAAVRKAAIKNFLRFN